MYRFIYYWLFSSFVLFISGCASTTNTPPLAPAPIVKQKATLTQPSNTPLLRLNNGMHTEPIYSISTDAQQRYILTASSDKTAKLWSSINGKLLHTFRPPQGSHGEGNLRTAALSPNGEIVAVAGYTGYQWDNQSSIYLFDRQSGKLIRRLSGEIPYVTFDLQFSSDGRYLAASLGGNNGIRVFNYHTGELVFKDNNYEGSSYSIDFAMDGRLISTCLDGYLRLYSADFKLLAKQKSLSHELVSARFSPNGQNIAVGGINPAKVSILSAKDLTHLYSADTTAVNTGDLRYVTWSADGQVLYAGGLYHYNNQNHFPIAAWSNSGKGELRWLPAASDAVFGLLALTQGDLFYITANPALGRVSSQGKTRFQKNGEIADFRAKHKQFLLSNQGKELQFGYQFRGKQPAQFNITARQLLLEPSQFSDLKAPDTNSLPIKGWAPPTLNGKPLALDQGQEAYSLAISPDQQQFLLGTSWYLRLFDKNGTQVWQQAIPATAWGVNIAGNGKVAIAAFGDGTIRWYRLQDGVELLAFYPHPDKKRWVVWTPQGYYDASAGAENLIGWHVNRGKDQAADFYSIGKFREQYYRPDVIAQVLNTYDVSQALALANQQAGKRQQQTATVNSLLPPVLTILSPDEGSRFQQAQVTLTFNTRTPSGEPVSNIKVLVDGRVNHQQRGLKRVGQGQGQTDKITLTLPKRDVEISLIAENRFAASEPASIRLRWIGKAEGFVIKPKLYVLSVGNSDYDNSALKLNYAAKDARDFASLIQQQQAKLLYREVVIKSVLNGSKDDILDGLEWIERQVTAKDVAMVFMAGHGVNDRNGNYYFLPREANTQKIKRTGLPYSSIKDTIINLPGKVLYFLDTCHSGNVMGSRRGNADINRVVNDLTSAENGVIVFAASSGNQYSLENVRWGNGAFTKALLEGIGGKADFNHTGRITINMLDLYLSERVKALTDGQQTPTTTKPKTIADFPVVMN